MIRRWWNGRVDLCPQCRLTRAEAAEIVCPCAFGLEAREELRLAREDRGQFLVVRLIKVKQIG